MLIGYSGTKGILVYDTKADKNNNSVYGYYEDDNIKTLTGNHKELRALQVEDDKSDEKNNNMIYKLMLTVFIIFLIFIIFAILYLPLTYIIATIFFCLSAYLPILIIIYASTTIYKVKTTRNQFRRFHGAEHALILLLNHEKDLTLENIKKEQYFDGECGTAYAQSAIVFEIIISYIIINLINLGFIKSILIIFITLILLFLNVFNRYNPFFLIQRFVVSKPTDKEYILALEIGRTLKKELDKTMNNGD